LKRLAEKDEEIKKLKAQVEAAMKGKGNGDGDDSGRAKGKSEMKKEKKEEEYQGPTDEQLNKLQDAENKGTIRRRGRGKKDPNKPKRKLSEKMKKRNALVKKIMKERGVKLIEASKIIKREGLM